MRQLVTALLACSLAFQALASYTPELAQEMAFFSSIAYCPGDQLEKWSCKPCKQHPLARNSSTVQYNEGRNVLSYVSQLSTGEALVVFRGTEPLSLKDWIKDDLEFAKLKPASILDCGACKVHEGFYDSYMALRPGILAALAAQGTVKGSSVYVTGHSLGAAMASLAMLDLHGQGFNIQQSYTFGQPRVGDDAYYSAFKAAMGVAGEFRVVHNCDPVPHLPLELMGFHHVSTEVWYDESNDDYVVCDGSGEDPACEKCLLPVNVLDHLDYVHVAMGTLCGIPVNATAPVSHGSLRGH